MARLTGDTACAQELTQETFIRTYRALVRGEQWDNPRAWLYRVASRLATDDYRRRKLRQWLPLSGLEPDDRQSLETAVTESVAVQSALSKLSPKYRIPLILYVYHEWPVAEIAETLELSVSAVKMRLSRARDKFRQAYGQDAMSVGKNDAQPSLNQAKSNDRVLQFWPGKVKEGTDEFV